MNVTFLPIVSRFISENKSCLAEVILTCGNNVCNHYNNNIITRNRSTLVPLSNSFHWLEHIYRNFFYYSCLALRISLIMLPHTATSWPINKSGSRTTINRSSCWSRYTSLRSQLISVSISCSRERERRRKREREGLNELTPRNLDDPRSSVRVDSVP